MGELRGKKHSAPRSALKALRGAHTKTRGHDTKIGLKIGVSCIVVVPTKRDAVFPFDSLWGY